MTKKELWLNLANYHFEHLVQPHLLDYITATFGGENAFTKAFATKLSSKLNWEIEFALHAIWEYKKFVYMGVVSNFSVTPSKVIDQVWHQHLLFSAGYRDFCSNVIAYNFDHNPELVAVDSQTETFQIQYFKTLELYETEFGALPPSEIWDLAKFAGNKEELKKRLKKKQENNHNSSNFDDTGSLISLFPSASGSDFAYGGGEFSGGGASGGWDDNSGDSSDSDSGGDASGDSSCSSSCGSGCGGGD